MGKKDSLISSSKVIYNTWVIIMSKLLKKSMKEPNVV